MISSTIRKAGPYAGDGTSTVFPFAFKVFSVSDVVVVKTSTTGVESTLPTGFTTVLNTDQDAGPGGTVALTVPLAIGERLTITSQVAATQPMQLTNGGGFFPRVLNDSADRLTILVQQIAERVSRTLAAPISSDEPLNGLLVPSASARAGKVLAFDATGAVVPINSAGIPDGGLRTDLAQNGASKGGDLIGVHDNATPAGSKFTTLQGMIDKLRNAAYGADLIPFDSTQTLTDATVANELVPRVTLAQLAAVSPKTNKLAFVVDDGKEGVFKCFPGAAPVADLWQGLYVTSNTAGFYWARLWNGKDASPEWWGVKPNDSSAAASNDTKIAAAYAIAPHLQFGPWDYWHANTIVLAIDHHKISGCGEKYNDQFGAMTRFVCTSNSVTQMQVGPNVQPGSINSMPQGIVVRNLMLGRSVAPLISSNCIGLLSRWVLNAVVENVKSDGSMVGFQEQGTVHTFKINCEAVRASAGTGAGADYFIGHYAYGSGSIGAAGGNASLYNVNCTAGCNYGPLQTATGSIGFKADDGFTDVWYWNPETTNFYIAQGVFGNDSTGLVYSNTDFMIDHPIHDQFHYVGLYVTDVATSGSVEIENPYYGPGSGSRAAYWVNSSEGAVVSRGGQWVMGGMPTCQPIILSTARGCDVVDYPVILEAGNTWPIVSMGDVSDARVEVFAKNPTVSAGAVVQVSGTCANIQVAAKTSGKASAFQYGYQLLGVAISRSTFNVSGLNSTNFPAANRQLDNNETPITVAGTFATTNLAEGNFN